MNFIIENYNWWRAGHIIFVIFWMAGLLFLPRQFVYQFQVVANSDASRALIEQQARLIRIILKPSALMVWLFGILLFISIKGQANSWQVFASVPWAIKIISVISMTGIHGFYTSQHKSFAQQKPTKTENFWRIMNEAPALLAIIIVITAVVLL